MGNVTVNKDKIVISHDGKTTTATMYHEDGTKATATANCSPEDEFDFAVGTKMALERLVAKPTKDAAEVVVDGFKVGDRVIVGNLTGTIICITTKDTFGIQFDNENYYGHTCRGIPLKAGKPSVKANCWWVSPSIVAHLKDENAPLSIEELRAMNGQSVYVVSLDGNKNPYADNFLGGWHRVNIRTDKLFDAIGDYYSIEDNDSPHGFLAYRTAPSK